MKPPPLLLALLVLLAGCAPGPSPVSTFLLYYPQSPSACPQGVSVQGRLPRDTPNMRNYFERVRYFADGADYGSASAGEDVPYATDGATISFQITRPAASPSLEEALTGPPYFRTWKSFYDLRYITSGADPELTLRCGEAAPPLVVQVGRPFRVVVVVEDPSAPSGLRAVQHKRQ